MKVHVVDANNFAAVNVDDLLIEQVAAQQQQAFGSVGQYPAPAEVAAQTPPLMAKTAANGSAIAGLEDLREQGDLPRSSCGSERHLAHSAPAAPDESYTVEPNNSLRARLLMVMRIQNCSSGSQMNAKFIGKIVESRCRTDAAPKAEAWFPDGLGTLTLTFPYATGTLLNSPVDHCRTSALAAVSISLSVANADSGNRSLYVRRPSLLYARFDAGDSE